MKNDRVPQGYECGDCGGFQKVRVDPDDAGRSIRYYCDSCRGFNEHEPTGSPSWFE